MDPQLVWHKVGESSQIPEGERIHVRINLRYVTIFRNKGVISAIDSICHHAGGPLTLGPLRDIEDLGVTVVLCPWHKFMVSIDKGQKAYQSVEIINGKPQNVGWRLGKTVQRVHKIYEDSSGVYMSLDISGEECVSDRDACSQLCAQDYPIHSEVVSSIDSGK